MDITTKVQYLKGVGPKKVAALARMGIVNIYDLLTYFPRRYEDQTDITPIGELSVDSLVNIQGELINIQESTSRRGMTILKLYLADATGSIQLVFFNQKFLKQKFTVGQQIFARGKVAYAYGGYGTMSLSNISICEVVHEDSTLTSGLKPIYTLPANIKYKDFTKIKEQALELLPQLGLREIVPANLRLKNNHYTKAQALISMHHPQSKEDLLKARQALIFEELFALQAGLLMLKKQVKTANLGICFRDEPGTISWPQQLIDSLPFTLTEDQQKVWEDIVRDMSSREQMNRLVQGDVGTGKTIVAVLAMLKAAQHQYQAALMVPTEILAIQHYDTIKSLVEPLGITIRLLIGSLSAKNKQEIVAELASGSCQIVIGTHALLQEAVVFKQLGLVITDEQHRFGVRQRAILEEKSQGYVPDVLIMTATPIPRTMTLTVYGDLDVSFIKQLPPGRKPIRTFVRNTDRRHLIYEFIRGEVAKGRQAYVVCPLIEESEAVDTISVEEIYEELTHKELSAVRCGLLHGRLGSSDKEELLNRFTHGEIDVLISTTVVEVGVNVPNANVMVIEGADRFGLAQLHQLRGRIGRGEYASYCILVNRSKRKIVERLQLMEQISDGFVLAEEDLRLRGPGQFFGSNQHGMPDLKIANILGDVEILYEAHTAAKAWLDFGVDKKVLQEFLQLQYQGKFAKILDT